MGIILFLRSLYYEGEGIGFRLFRATGLAFAIRPKDGVARQGRRGGFHCYCSKVCWNNFSVVVRVRGRATGLVFASCPKDRFARQGRRGGFHFYRFQFIRRTVSQGRGVGAAVTKGCTFVSINILRRVPLRRSSQPCTFAIENDYYCATDKLLLSLGADRRCLQGGGCLVAVKCFIGHRLRVEQNSFLVRIIVWSSLLRCCPSYFLRPVQFRLGRVGTSLSAVAMCVSVYG